MSDEHAREDIGLRPAPLVAGAMLLLAHYSLADQVVFRSELGKSFLYLSWRESLFWISHYLLLVPGLLLMAWALAPRVGPAVLGAWRGLRRWSEGAASRRRALLLVLGVLLFTASLAGRKVLLLDLPVTNDEYTLRFGAAILAAGEVTAPDIDPDFAFTMPYVFRHEGRIASMDFPGTMLVLAAGQTTGLGHALVALLVALSGLALVTSCRRLDGARGLWLAALAWLLAPMVWTLSMTEHSQLLSRVWVAFAWAIWIGRFWRMEPEDEDGEPNVRDEAAGEAGWGALLGLATALGFASRPAEVGMVMAPVAVHLLLWTWRTRRYGFAVGAVVTSLLGPLFLLWWNVQISGRWNVSPRVLSNRTMSNPFLESLWPRLGGNVGFNLMMLTLWFVGPLLAVLVLFALRRRRSTGKGGTSPSLAVLSAWAVALELLLALFHSDTGNHLVGPIHYAESAVPLLVLAVLGWRRASAWWHEAREGAGLPSTGALATLLAAYALGLVLWSGMHTGSLFDQALVQRYHLDAVADLENAIVIADRPYKLWFARPEIGAISSWVAELPHPDPYLRGDVLFAYPEADVDKLRQAFPDRKLYRMTYSSEGDPVRVVPLEP